LLSHISLNALPLNFSAFVATRPDVAVSFPALHASCIRAGFPARPGVGVAGDHRTVDASSRGAYIRVVGESRRFRQESHVPVPDLSDVYPDANND